MKIGFDRINKFRISIHVGGGASRALACAKPYVVISGKSRSIARRLQVVLTRSGIDNVVAKPHDWRTAACIESTGILASVRATVIQGIVEPFRSTGTRRATVGNARGAYTGVVGNFALGIGSRANVINNIVVGLNRPF